MTPAMTLLTLGCLVAALALTSAKSRRELDLITAPVAPTTPPSPPVTITQQRQEAAALIKLKGALNNHPAFNGFDETKYPQFPFGGYAWTTTPAPSFPESLPCSMASWAWVSCSEAGRVVGLNLNGGEYLNTVNSSWGYTGSDPITGTVDFDTLMPLSELNFISLGLQRIGGSLKGINNFPKLQNLSIGSNLFTHGIPQEISQLTVLQAMRIDNNQFTGAIPDSVSTMTNLAALVVGVNTLSGTFPDWVSTLTNLQTLDMSSNSFHGTLPQNWSTLVNLNILLLQNTPINGSFPASWSAMTSLHHISAMSCNLQSAYPNFLTQLPGLQEVYLTSNNFYGPLPTNLFSATTLTTLNLDQNFFNGTLPTAPDNVAFKSGGNCFSNYASDASYSPKQPGACSSFYQKLYYVAPPPAPPAPPVPTSSGTNTTIIIVGIVVPLCVLLALAALAVYYFRNNRRSRISKIFTKGLRQTTREFTLSELKPSTQNWSTVIGKGGYGTVYKAELKDATVVAVKRLDQVSKQGDMEFIREVELLSRVHHRHLVNLLGFCAERGERALIYEYMAMGSLYEHLHGESAKNFPLSWDSRCKIAIHVALGIEYLHYGADPPLIHRDIKSANILLSDDGYSKVADFGLCKEAPVGAAADGSEQLVPTATAVRGSFGYLDPEYVNTSILSEKSDVYSYGVVLLELISGHKSIHDWQPLAYWAEEYLADREKTPRMVDPALEGNFDLDELYALCDIARTCVQDQSVNRPTIRDVAKALVENLGHGMTSFTGSLQDSASIVASSQTDASSMPSTTYTPPSASNDVESKEFSYQNYSETLHWTPNASGQMSTKSGSGLTISTGAKGDHLPVPVPRRPKDSYPKDEGAEEENKK